MAGQHVHGAPGAGHRRHHPVLRRPGRRQQRPGRDPARRAGRSGVLAVVFGSFIAITPLIIAAVAIPTAFAFIYALTYADHDVHPGAEHRRPGRPGRGHRLRAAHRDPLAGGTRQRPGQPGGGAAGIRHRGQIGAVLRHHRHREPGRARAHHRPVPAQHRPGRDAHPADQHRRVGHPPARHPRHGSARRLEWPRRRPARTVSPLWTRIARRRRRPPGLVGRRGAGHPGRADRPRSSRSTSASRRPPPPLPPPRPPPARAWTP